MTSDTSSFRLIRLSALGAMGLVAHVWMAHLAQTAPSVGALLVPMGIAGFAFAVSAWTVLSTESSARSPSTLAVVMVLAVLFRLAALPAPPLLDDDLYRYMWDGKVWASGIDPYLYAPDNVLLEPLRDEHYQRIGFKYLRTIYPPLAQVLFRVAHCVAPGSVVGLKSLWMVFDTATIALIMALLSRFGLPKERVLLYAWNPLVIKELANSGHVDTAAISLLLAACALALMRRPTASAVVLGLATLVKLFPLVALPILRRRWAPAHVVLYLAVVALGYVPFREEFDLIVDALGVYAQHWEYNDSLFAALGTVARSVGLGAAAGTVLKVGLGAGIFVGADRAGAAAGGDDRATLRAVSMTLGALLLVSPTVQPWYVLWITPFLCLFPWAGWLAFSVTVLGSYAFHIEGRDQWWIRPIEYLPLALWLLFRRRT